MMKRAYRTPDELIDDVEARLQAMVAGIKAMTPQERAANARHIDALRRMLAAALAKLDAKP